jgi:hypothetical protein
MCDEISHDHRSTYYLAVINLSAFTVGCLPLQFLPPSIPLDKPVKCRLKSKHNPNDWRKRGANKEEEGLE